MKKVVDTSDLLNISCTPINKFIPKKNTHTYVPKYTRKKKAQNLKIKMRKDEQKFKVYLSN